MELYRVFIKELTKHLIIFQGISFETVFNLKKLIYITHMGLIT